MATDTLPPITLAAAPKTLGSARYLPLCLATIAQFVLGAPADLRLDISVDHACVAPDSGPYTKER